MTFSHHTLSAQVKSALCAALALLAVPVANPQPIEDLHAPFAGLLQTYVVAGKDGVNRVDYGALKENKADQERLDSYIGQYADLDFDALSEDQQFAAWANLYNAVTLRYIIGEYPLSTIKPWYSSGPWKKIRVIADGREVSLDGIEHDILRKQWAGDPRLHYAINCASYGCPNLRTIPWQAETLDKDLDAAARAYINHPRGVSLLDRGLQVSSIYDWFEADFGGSEAAVVDHLLSYAEAGLAEKIRANPDIRKYAYDWSLNETGR